MSTKYHHAFTLLELLISVALLGTLVVLGIVALNPFEQVKKGTDTVRRAVANDIYTAINNVYIKSGNFAWGTDIIAAPLNSAQGETVITSLITAGELTASFRKLAQKDLSRIVLSSSVDGSVLWVCFLPDSKTFRNDPNTRYDQYGNPVDSCPSSGCYACVGNGKTIAQDTNGDTGVGGGVGQTAVSITPTSVPTLVPTIAPTATPTVAMTPTPLPTPSPTPIPIGAPITKKIYLVVFNPKFSAAFGNQSHIQYYGVNDPYTLTNNTIAWFKTITNNRVNYVVTKQVELNAYPALTDGFVYTESTYNSMITGATPVHQPVWANYNAIVSETQACELFNSGQIDELWMFGGSWFGFYESRLAGTGAFWYNSPALSGTTCAKPMPIMGYNFERGVPEMVHNFGHRTEYTMMKVYTAWAKTRIYTNFDRFAFVQALAPSSTFSGCGTTHFPPNAPVAYDYSNMAQMQTMCDDFVHYPNLIDIASVPKLTVDCRTWSCTDIGFYAYWYTHLPQFTGVGTDGKLNDWWDYMLNPSKAL